MEYRTYASRLRYLDADDVDDGVVDYDGLDIQGPDGDKLGEVDGFIVDAHAGRVYYVVVDSGGWFSSRRFLLPIGHATLDDGARALRVDVSRDALSRYPEFHENSFRDFTDEDLRIFESRMVEACCPGEGEETGEPSVRSWAYDTRRHYTQPSWWAGGQFATEHLRPVNTRAFRNTPPPTAAPVREVHQTEFATGREGVREVSPHLDGRAQPGDVLGIETGGERTAIGDTAEAENRRRETAERALADDDAPGRSDR
jgi:hypothetical protein